MILRLPEWAAGAVTIASLVAFSTSSAVDRVSDHVRHEPVTFSVIELRFDGEHIWQTFAVTGTDAIRADWAAEINRGARQLCSGGGTAPYQNNRPKAFLPEEWAGPGCGPLHSGDELLPTWVWVDENGLRHTETTSYIIPADIRARN